MSSKRFGVQQTMQMVLRLPRAAWVLWRRDGFSGLRYGVERLLGKPAYAEWVQRYDSLTDRGCAKVQRRISALRHNPLISLVMPVYDPPVELLDKAIRSVRNQLYPHWELCIADDASPNPEVRAVLRRHASEDRRIKIAFRQENGHISRASNSALTVATGEFIALLDHDDLLPVHALFWVAHTINRVPDVGVIYSDEDKIDAAGRRHDPYFKCDWNPNLFLSHNMICHLGVYRTELVRQVGGFREGFEGSQDYDLALRCVERVASHQIQHVPRVLYHWRVMPGSTAMATNEKPYALVAGEKAINEHLQRTGVDAVAELQATGHYRVRYRVPDPSPLVSLIIPTRDGLALIRRCVTSILERTAYKRYEILVVDNGSNEPNTLAYFDRLSSQPNIRILRDDRPFNYSTLNNAAVATANGTIVGLINNDIEVISQGWLTEMVGLAVQPGVGAVGARLWYADDTLQHGGVVLGVGGVAGHAHKGIARGVPGYFGRADLLQGFSAVTAACMLVRKASYLEVGGLNETDLPVAFNDVDFCLKLIERGYRNVWTPYADLYHHESATRGYEDSPAKQARFRSEIDYMQSRWGSLLESDPAYSPNLTLDREDFSLAWPPRTGALATL